MVTLAEGLSSPPLAAFAQALGTHLWNDDFGRFETEAENLEENGYYDEMVEHLDSLGHADAEAICIGNTGGGEEALLMVADETRDGGYVIYRFAYDGSPYENGKPIVALGLVVDLVRALQREGDVSDDLKAVVAEAG